MCWWLGAGGLGSPLILYLAAAGIGTIGIVDFDTVGLSNLQRQIAHRTGDVGRLKTESATDAARAINPHVAVEPHAVRLDAGNALELISRYDIVADGSDNFATRFLVNDAAFFARKILVSAAVTEFDGQLATFKAYDRKARDGLGTYPCYRCIFPEPPPPRHGAVLLGERRARRRSRRDGGAAGARSHQGDRRHRRESGGQASDL